MSEVVRRGGRIEWLDSARGIAIILVVLGHCIGYIDEGNPFIPYAGILLFIRNMYEKRRILEGFC